MDFSPLQTAAWPDLVALALFAGCATAGLIVLARSARADDAEPPVFSPGAPPTVAADLRLKESLRGAGYELLSVSRGQRVSAGALGEFGFRGSAPGWVRRIRVKTWDGTVREGWLSVCGEPALQTAGRHGGYRAPDHLEITWDY